LNANILRTEISRTVIDVNRDPSGTSLYRGQAKTGLCPLTSFDGEPSWREERLMTRIYNVGGLQTALACRGYMKSQKFRGRKTGRARLFPPHLFCPF
jgi:hypothetical protein